MARTVYTGGAKKSAPGQPVKRPNTIKGPINSPDSKHERARQHEREVLNAALLIPGVSISYVRKTVDHGSDGFVDPLRKGIDSKDPDLVGINYCGALRMADGTDVAQKNTGVNFIRRTFVSTKPNCDGLSVEDRLDTVMTICNVSTILF
jgi:hypothetical protein